MLVIATFLAARLHLRNITSSGYCPSMIMTQVDPNYPSCLAARCAGALGSQCRSAISLLALGKHARSMSFAHLSCAQPALRPYVRPWPKKTARTAQIHQRVSRRPVLIVPALAAVVSGPADFWKSTLVQVKFPTRYRVDAKSVQGAPWRLF